MKQLVMVEEPANVTRFLAAMGEATEVPRLPIFLTLTSLVVRFPGMLL
jgi:hypothetical protein